MTTLAITRNTTALAALYSVQINNNLVALYETAEPVSLSASRSGNCRA